MAADFQSLVVFQRVQAFAAEEPLVVACGPVVAHHYSAASGVLYVLVQLFQRGGEGLEVGLPVVEQPPEVIHIQHWQFAAHVGPGDFREAQRAVGHQLHRVRPGYTQLGVADDLNIQLAVGALQHVGNKLAFLGLAGEQLVVEAAKDTPRRRICFAPKGV